METKKKPKTELWGNRVLFFVVGVIVALGVTALIQPEPQPEAEPEVKVETQADTTPQTAEDTDPCLEYIEHMDIDILDFDIENVKPDEGGAYLTVSQMPTFAGGDIIDFCHWVNDRVEYPSNALWQGISGMVYITFVVEPDGSLSNLDILQSPHGLLSAEAVRVLNSSPKWEPGIHKGHKVKVRFTVPVEFAIPD